MASLKHKLAAINSLMLLLHNNALRVALSSDSRSIMLAARCKRIK